LSLTVFTQRNFVTDFLQAKYLKPITPVSLFWIPPTPLRGWGATYIRWSAGSLESTYGLYARWYGWSATSEYRFKIGDFSPTGTGDSKFQVQPFFFSEN